MFHQSISARFDGASSDRDAGHVAGQGVLAVLLTAVLIAVPALPALGHDTDSDKPVGEAYTVEADTPDEESLPEGGEIREREIEVAPALVTAASPGGWLAPVQTTETYVVHTVQSGDSLGALAAEYGLDGSTGWRVLFDANPEVKQPWRIWPGLELDIPADGDELERRAVPDKPKPVTRSASSKASRSATRGTAVSGGRWDILAQCESNGNWAINTGNGYYGGLQFSLSSWRMVGGSGYPHQNSKAEQIRRAEKLLALQGWRAWPACTRKLGWR